MGYLNKHLIQNITRLERESPNSVELRKANEAMDRSQELCSHPKRERRACNAPKNMTTRGIKKGDRMEWCLACSGITSHHKIQQTQPCQDG